MGLLINVRKYSAHKWRHSAYITQIHDLYINRNPYINKFVKINPFSNIYFIFRPSDKGSIEYHSRFCGRIIQHLDKHCKILVLNTNGVEANLSKWAYDGMILVVLYIWKYIHHKDQVVLLVSFVKTIRNVRHYTGNESFSHLIQSLNRFLKCLLIYNESLLSEVNGIAKLDDHVVFLWKMMANLMISRVEAYGGEGTSEDNLFVELIKRCEMNKDYVRLTSIIYWLKELNYSEELLARPLKLLVKSFKNNLDGASARDVINMLYYANMFYDLQDDVTEFLQKLDVMCNKDILSLTIKDCNQILNVLATWFVEDDGSNANLFQSLILCLLINIDYMYNRVLSNADNGLIMHPNNSIIKGYYIKQALHNSNNDIHSSKLFTDIDALETLSYTIFGRFCNLHNFVGISTNYNNWSIIAANLKSISPFLDTLQPYCDLLANKLS